jgi:predicted transcriptional regulator
MNAMLPQQFRSEMGMISDILRITVACGKQGTIISAISRRANLSHYVTIEKCQKLVDFGLMESITDKRNHTFIITEKGMQFFQEMKKFIEKSKEMKTSGHHYDHGCKICIERKKCECVECGLS